jgi:integrase
VSKRRNPTPSYLQHKQSGRARAVWTDVSGIRQQKLLPGAYDSAESRTAFARLQLELEEKYDRGSYGVAVDRACDKAFPAPAPLAQREDESVKAWWERLTEAQRGAVKAWRKAHRWHPHQLRHSYATKVRKAFDLEAAQVMLGHSRADVTQIYAEKNEALAATVAAKIG